VDGEETIERREDSLAVLRMDFVQRNVDTVGWLGTGSWSIARYTAAGSTSGSSSYDLFRFYDDAIATSDGAIGILRAREYRFDWIAPDGRRSRGVRLPYAWRSLAGAEKQIFVDSLNAARLSVYDSVMAKRAADSARDGGVRMTTSTSSINGVVTTRQVPVSAPPRPVVLGLDDVPDYLPPTGVGSLLADADGRVWVQPIERQRRTDSYSYDIVSRTEGLVDRVRIPINRVIAGFSPGHVFLVVRDAGVATIEKVRVK
jgi:hypothetical protein